MRDLLIRLLFRLLGHDYTRQHNISVLFGARTEGHKDRQKRWEQALATMYRNKDLLDFLFYQAESDKEQVFKGKIHPDLSRGARLRTLFIVYSARKAYEVQRKRRTDVAETVSAIQEDVQEVDKAYKALSDIHK